MAISNRYKDILDDLINSSDVESSDRLGPIDKGSCNLSRSERSLTRLLERDCLDKNILDKSSRLAPKTRDSQVYQLHDFALLIFKSGRLQYWKVQKGGKSC